MHPGMGTDLSCLLLTFLVVAHVRPHPLLLQGELDHRPNTSFWLKNFWTEMDGFQELVQEIWNRSVSSALPIKRLHIKMVRVAKEIKRWKKDKIGDTKLQLAIVKEVMLQLEAA